MASWHRDKPRSRNTSLRRCVKLTPFLKYFADHLLFHVAQACNNVLSPRYLDLFSIQRTEWLYEGLVTSKAVKNKENVAFSDRQKVKNKVRSNSCQCHFWLKNLAWRRNQGWLRKQRKRSVRSGQCQFFCNFFPLLYWGKYSKLGVGTRDSFCGQGAGEREPMERSDRSFLFPLPKHFCKTLQS